MTVPSLDPEKCVPDRCLLNNGRVSTEPTTVGFTSPDVAVSALRRHFLRAGEEGLPPLAAATTMDPLYLPTANLVADNTISTLLCARLVCKSTFQSITVWRNCKWPQGAYYCRTTKKPKRNMRARDILLLIIYFWEKIFRKNYIQILIYRIIKNV